MLHCWDILQISCAIFYCRAKIGFLPHVCAATATLCLCRYAEAHEAEGPIDAMLGAFGHTIVHLVATVPLFRNMVSPLLPKPGDGPPEAFRERNHWKFTLYGWTLEQGRERSKQCQVSTQVSDCMASRSDTPRLTWKRLHRSQCGIRLDS